MAARADFGVAKFAVISVADLAAKLLRHGLHAVTNTEDRNAKRKNTGGHFERALFVGRSMASRQNDALEALSELST